MNSIIEALKHNRPLLIVMTVAVFARIYGLTHFSLSNDELSALSRLQFDSVGQVIRQGVIPDFHPAGVQLFLYIWTSLFGFEEWIVRLPFALMGVVSVFFLYMIGKWWFGEITGLLAATALALLEFPLLYSQIARPYSPGLMMSLAAALSWTMLLFDEKPTRKKQLINVLLFSLTIASCMYTHYFSFIFAGILCLSGLFFLKSNRIPAYLISGALIVILFLPHLRISIDQISRGGIGGPDGWLGPPDSDTLKEYFNYIFNNSTLLKTLYIIIFTGTIFLYRREIKLTKFHFLSFWLFITPFIVAYYYSLNVNPVYQHSVQLFSFPFLLLVLFSMIPRSNHGFTSRFLWLVILCGTCYSTVVEKKYFQTSHFTEFRRLVQRTITLNQQLGEANITRTAGVFAPYYLYYYHQLYNDKSTYSLTRILDENERKYFLTILDSASTPWFLHSYSNMYFPSEFDAAIKQRYPYLALRDSFLGSELRLYSRDPIDSSLSPSPVFELSYGFERGEWNGEIPVRDSTISLEGRYSIKMNELLEFSPGYTGKLRELGAGSSSDIEVSVAFKATEMLAQSLVVLSLDHEGKNIFWKGELLTPYQITVNKWNRAFLVASLPENLTGGEEIKIYIWNNGKGRFWMDDMRIKVY